MMSQYTYSFWSEAQEELPGALERLSDPTPAIAYETLKRGWPSVALGLDAVGAALSAAISPITRRALWTLNAQLRSEPERILDAARLVVGSGRIAVANGEWTDVESQARVVNRETVRLIRAGWETWTLYRGAVMICPRITGNVPLHSFVSQFTSLLFWEFPDPGQAPYEITWAYAEEHGFSPYGG